MNDDVTALFGMPGFQVAEQREDRWSVASGGPDATRAGGVRECGAVATVKDRREVTVRDLPVAGVPVVIRWRKRVFHCRHVLCPNKSWTEQHDAIAPRAVLTERARQWAFEQVAHRDRAVTAVAADLGVAWHTIMTQVHERGTPLLDDPTRLPGDERDRCGRDGVPARHRDASDAVRHRCRGPDAGPARRGCWTWCRAVPAGCWVGGSPTGTRRGGPGSAPPHSIRSVGTPPP